MLSKIIKRFKIVDEFDTILPEHSIDSLLMVFTVFQVFEGKFISVLRIWFPEYQEPKEPTQMGITYPSWQYFSIFLLAVDSMFVIES